MTISALTYGGNDVPGGKMEACGLRGRCSFDTFEFLGGPRFLDGSDEAFSGAVAAVLRGDGHIDGTGD